MHFGINNIENDLGGDNLIPLKIEKTLVERDLGILLPSDLKLAYQTDKAISDHCTTEK